MQRLTSNQSSVTLSPKQKRLSVGFGAGASIQIHNTATPPAMQPRSLPAHGESKVAFDDGGTPGRRKSLHEALLMRLLSTPSDEPLFQRSASGAPESQRTADDSFDSCLSGRSSPLPELDLLHQTPDAMRCNTPPAVESGGAAALPPPNRHMQLLMRDYNSPSATARLRAVRALNSVSKRNAYGNFDVSYAEQDIITAEERQALEKRTIEDVMREVCVYVEVRSGTDNRSDGIKEHIKSLGAKVNERLLKDTTHVIFKDGLLSTYQKAKKMNIPIVSILWIEACKRHTCLMNPNDFKISNLERYENPDLFKRIRRQKSMQPGAEATAGAKKRPNVTAKAKAATTVISPPSKLPVLHRLRKNDGLERILNDFEAEHINSSTDEPVDEYDQLLQAAPMRMLERFRSTPTPVEREGDNEGVTTPTTTTTTSAAVEETPQAGGANDTTQPRRALFTGSGSKQPTSITPRGRRRTVMFTPQMTNVEEEQTEPETTSNNEIEETPKPAARNRRKTIVAPNEETFSNVPEKSSLVTNRRKTIVAAPAANESKTVPSTTTTRAARSRRSTMIPNVTGKENVSPAKDHSSHREQPEGLISINISSLPSLSTRVSSRRKTIVADSKEAEVSTEAHTPAMILSKNKCTRRKTIAFGNEENTPPVPEAAISMDVTKTDSIAKKIITKARGTICSPKDMEMSNILQKQTTEKKGPAAGELTKINSIGSVISISSEEGNRAPIITTAPKDRRRTLFIPSVEGAMDGLVKNDTARSSLEQSLTNRRRTLFTPGHSTPMEPLEVSETPPTTNSLHQRTNHCTTHADGSSIINRPNPASSSTPKSTVEPTMPGSAPHRGKTLLQQYEDSLIFSSTRVPDHRRRRTVFDITMDIMDHRLSEINRQAAAVAAASKPPPSVPAAVEEALKSPQGTQTSLDAYYRKAAKSCEKSTQPTVAKATEEAAPRKRKLFNIQTSEEDVMQRAATSNRKTPAVTSKRHSMAPGSATTAAVSEMKSPTSSLTKKRRTTGLFTTQADRDGKEAPRKNLFPVGRGLPTMATQYPASGSQQNGQPAAPRQYLTTTNLHTEQSTFVKEALKSLDGFIIEAKVTDNTTHLVTYEPRRTINLLRALIRGLWILRYEWIVESYRAGRWLPEERFELRDFSRAIQLNRSERQAFGSQYRNELFADYAPFWISSRCAVPAHQMRELVLLCRGKVTGSPSRAKFLVVDPNHNDAAPIEGQIVVAPDWILDSITINKVKKLLKKYRIE